MNKEEREKRRKAILKMQFQMAMNGSVDMLKWLGIQYCQQSTQPKELDAPLPQGFDIKRIMNDYEQETVKEYEKYREEFLKWKGILFLRSYSTSLLVA